MFENSIISKQYQMAVNERRQDQRNRIRRSSKLGDAGGSDT